MMSFKAFLIVQVLSNVMIVYSLPEECAEYRDESVYQYFGKKRYGFLLQRCYVIYDILF